ncbi:hypothetical protein [Paracoccus sp. (in: a-proteobacteria)]|uniref:hypothetical protein n=1 Tax=Paracoccus sp. TaxID=267 RepID=UPI003A87AA14
MNSVPARGVLRIRWLLIAAAFGILVVFLGVWLNAQTRPLRFALPMNLPEEPAESRTTLGWPGPSGWPASAYLALEFGRHRGLVAEVQPSFRVAGKGAVASLRDGTVDAAYSFAPPVVHAIAEGGDDLVVAGVVMRSYDQVRLFVSAEHVDDWHRGNIAVTKGTILESQVLAHLRAIGKLDQIGNGGVNLVHIERPESMFFVLMNRLVETSAMPAVYGVFLEQQQQSSDNPEFIDITIPRLYRSNGFILTTRDSLRKHHGRMIEMLRAYRDYGEFVAARPDEALKQMLALEAAGTPIDPDAASDTAWRPQDFILLTDHKEIRAILEAEAQLRIDGHALEVMPDFEPALSELDEISAALAAS